MQYDETILADLYLLSRNVRNAVMMRLSEKRVYKEWMMVAEIGIDMINQARQWFDEHPWMAPANPDEKSDLPPK